MLIACRLTRLPALLLAAICTLTARTTTMSAPARPLATELIIACYQAPPGETLAGLKEAGFNLVRAAATRQALDEVAAAGLRAWTSPGPLDLSEQAAERTAKLKETVAALKDHPALLLWEGPDEPLYQIWGPGYFDRHLPPEAPARLELVAECQAKAERLAQGLAAGHDLVRGLDPGRPLWINHAPRHPVAALAAMAGAADIHSFDFYPVPEDCGHSDLPNENLSAVGEYVDRLEQAMGGKPVWAVLQGFSWTEIGIRDVRRQVVYPSFAQSRFLAYDALLHGATGILYWGTHTLRADSGCWQSLRALAAELAALGPVLVAPDAGRPQVQVLSGWHSAALAARAALRQVDGQTYLLLVNEERYPLEVKVSGLAPLAGRELAVLYGGTQAVAADGSFSAALAPYGVYVYAPSRERERVRPGRDFGG